MKARNTPILMGLGIAALLAVIAAVAITLNRQPADMAVDNGYVLPELHGHVNDVTTVKLTVANNQTAVTLSQTEHGWTVAEKNGYPADAGKLRALLLKLADATLLEQKTANPQRHAELGVDDIHNATAKGIQVELLGLAKPVQLLVGNPSQSGSGSFVRRSDTPQSWLMSGNVPLSQHAEFWLDTNLVALPAAQVAEISVTPTGGQPWRLSKAKAEDSAFGLADLPAGRELKTQAELQPLAELLAAFQFSDVETGQQRPVPTDKPVLTASYRSFAGLVVALKLWQQEGKTYAQLTASAAPAAADVSAAQAEAARLNQRFSDWTYILAAYPFESLNKQREDLLKPLPQTGKK